MKQINQGFTLIELVVVILVIAILALIAVPQFIDLTTDAKTTMVRKVAGTLSSANAVNYTSRKANPARGVAINNCTSVANALLGGALPAGYVITSLSVNPDVTVSCTLTYTPSSGSAVTATFNATGIT